VPEYELLKENVPLELHNQTMKGFKEGENEKREKIKKVRRKTKEASK
jgi:hypothetical protein